MTRSSRVEPPASTLRLISIDDRLRHRSRHGVDASLESTRSRGRFNGDGNVVEIPTVASATADSKALFWSFEPALPPVPTRGHRNTGCSATRVPPSPTPH